MIISLNCFPVVGGETVLLMVSHLEYLLVKRINDLSVFSKHIENISVVASCQSLSYCCPVCFNRLLRGIFQVFRFKGFGEFFCQIGFRFLRFFFGFFLLQHSVFSYWKRNQFGDIHLPASQEMTFAAVSSLQIGSKSFFCCCWF